MLLLKPGTRWEIPPQSEERRETSGFKARAGDQNGSRIYQLLLHEMLLLPSNIPVKNRATAKTFNTNNSFKDQTGNLEADTQDDVDEPVAGKGRKRALDSLDSDDEGVPADASKRPRLVLYESDDADIEMADGVAA